MVSNLATSPFFSTPEETIWFKAHQSEGVDFERGLIEANGEKQSRIYHFSAAMSRFLKQPEGHVRVHGISASNFELHILEFVQAHGKIETRRAMALLNISRDQAKRLLRKMVEAGKLARRGTGQKNMHYVTANESSSG